MKVNVNQEVRIKITPFGMTIIEADPYLAISYFHKKEDKDGWTTWQLWEIMRDFGFYMDNGKEVPFETEIEIIE
jgi:hypothetical protein